MAQIVHKECCILFFFFFRKNNNFETPKNHLFSAPNPFSTWTVSFSANLQEQLNFIVSYSILGLSHIREFKCNDLVIFNVYDSPRRDLLSCSEVLTGKCIIIPLNHKIHLVSSTLHIFLFSGTFWHNRIQVQWSSHIQCLWEVQKEFAFM